MSEPTYEDWSEEKYKKMDQMNNDVLNFANNIVQRASREIKCELRFKCALDISETFESRIAEIESEFGLVNVFPDFVNFTAFAYVVNRGIIHNMHQEGFTREFIETNGKIYSEKLNFTDANVKTLSYYLTHKIQNASQTSRS